MRVLLVAQPHWAGIGKGQRVAAVARGHHAIEQVDAAADAFEQIDRAADAHQIARLVARQQRRRDIERRVHFWRRLADAQAADRVADEIERDKFLGRFGPQLGVEAALDDCELGLIVAGRRGSAALGPADAAPHGIGHDFARSLGSATTWSNTIATSLPSCS